MGEKTKRISFFVGVFLLAFVAVWTLRRCQSAPADGPAPFASKEVYDLAAKSPLAARDLPLLNKLNQEYARVTEGVVKSVVSLDTEGKASVYTTMPGYRPDVRDYKVRGLGSGVIVSKQGHIITNNHVIQGKQAIRARLWDGRSFTARKIGEDKVMDLAVLKIDVGEELLPLAFGDSDNVEVGHIVFAVGNPFGLGETVTQGIISAKQRSFGDLQSELLQTDAAINPGNSGGPLVNIFGEIIGINAAIYSDEKQSARSMGVGFSIPSNIVKTIFEQICQYGKPIRGYLGVSLLDPTPQVREILHYEGNSGVAVNELHAGSPAARAGLQTGDVILTFNGESVDSARELLQLIHNSPIGSNVTLGVWSKGVHKDITLAVAEAGAPVLPDTTIGEGVEKLNKLGFHLRSLTLEEYAAGARGVLVNALDKNTEAARIFRSGDLLLAVDNQPLNSLEDLNVLMKNKMATIQAIRGGRYQFVVRINLAAVPPGGAKSAAPSDAESPPEEEE